MYQSGCTCPCYLFVLWLCPYLCDYVYISVSHGGLFSVAVKSRCNCYLYFHYNYVRSIFKEVALVWLYFVEDCFLSQWSQGEIVTYLHCNCVRSLRSEVALAWLYLVEDCFLSQWSQGVIVTYFHCNYGEYSKRQHCMAVSRGWLLSVAVEVKVNNTGVTDSVIMVVLSGLYVNVFSILYVQFQQRQSFA